MCLCVCGTVFAHVNFITQQNGSGVSFFGFVAFIQSTYVLCIRYHKLGWDVYQAVEHILEDTTSTMVDDEDDGFNFHVTYMYANPTMLRRISPSLSLSLLLVPYTTYNI